MKLDSLSWLLVLATVRAEFSGSAVESKQLIQDPDNPNAFNQAPPRGSRILRRDVKVECDSSVSNDNCDNVIDDNQNSFWAASGSADHHIIIDLGSVRHVNGIEVLPRQDGNKEGYIEKHEVYVSNNTNDWGSPVAYGTWYTDKNAKFAVFEPHAAQYVRLVALDQNATIAELNVYEDTNENPQTSGGGVWGPTIDLPVIPVAGAVSPTTGEVMVWSAYLGGEYLNAASGWTMLATWNPKTNTVSKRNVSDTHHDMFCPGISYDGLGRIVVTGGSSSQRTTFYDPTNGTWIYGPQMNTARGYQASSTTSDGRVFLVGGSWNGGARPKAGEIFNPTTNEWTSLPGAKVQPMLTNDAQGIFRADNHGWFFGWKNNTVFQAGPSKNMNWYITEDDGDVTPAGPRGYGNDAMSGNAVMFDAAKGKIITFGGSPSYQDSNATADAFLIEINEPQQNATVTPAKNKNGEGLNYRRAYVTSVVLPNGNVFLTGGQVHAVPFTDATAQLTPELYNPETNSFETLKSNNIVRAYHSLSLLLQDGRVFNGGGGLCGNCTTNHFDAQIYTPQYLLTDDGQPAKRPVINSVSTSETKPGEEITFKADSPIKTASLVRYGTASHTVDTDQRRVALDLTDGEGDHEYQAILPSDPGVLLPGWWMLFALNEQGVPSISKNIRVGVL